MTLGPLRAAGLGVAVERQFDGALPLPERCQPPMVRRRHAGPNDGAATIVLGHDEAQTVDHLIAIAVLRTELRAEC